MSEYASAAAAEASHPIRLIVNDDLKRSRLTVFFRLILVIPHFIWITLWAIAAVFAVVIAWFVMIFAGRLPDGLHAFIAQFMRYSTHVTAYFYLVADPFPGFGGAEGSYPIDLHVDPPTQQGRLGAAFRIILAIPALILASVLSYLLEILAFVGWFYALFTGRMARGLRDLSAYCLRYSIQTYSYVALLTNRYPSLSSSVISP